MTTMIVSSCTPSPDIANYKESLHENEDCINSHKNHFIHDPYANMKHWEIMDECVSMLVTG